MSTLLSGGYSLIVIEDEPIALAGSIQTASNGLALFSKTIWILAVALIVLAIIAYVARCRQYQMRIATLCTNAGAVSERHAKWSIKSLRYEMGRLEGEIAASMIQS